MKICVVVSEKSSNICRPVLANLKMPNDGRDSVKMPGLCVNVEKINLWSKDYGTDD